MNVRIALRVAQIAEGAFALLALFFALSLPWPPRGPFLGLWLFWSSAFVLASWLAFRLGRPSRPAFVAAGVVSAIVLLLSVRRLFVIADPMPGVDRGILRTSHLLASFVWMTQLLVCICLWLGRKLPPPRRSVGSTLPAA